MFGFSNSYFSKGFSEFYGVNWQKPLAELVFGVPKQDFDWFLDGFWVGSLGDFFCRFYSYFGLVFLGVQQLPAWACKSEIFLFDCFFYLFLAVFPLISEWFWDGFLALFWTPFWGVLLTVFWNGFLNVFGPIVLWGL